MTKTVTDRGYTKEFSCLMDRGGYEHSCQSSTPVVLGDVKVVHEGLLSNISEPNLGAIGNNRNNDSQEDLTPWHKAEAPYAVPYNA